MNGDNIKFITLIVMILLDIGAAQYQLKQMEKHMENPKLHDNIREDIVQGKLMPRCKYLKECVEEGP